MTITSVTSVRLAEFLGCEHRGNEIAIKWATTLDNPCRNHLAFCVSTNSLLIDSWSGLSGVIIGPRELSVPDSCVLIVSDRPRRDFGRALQEFFVSKKISSVSSSAIIHPSAILGNSVSIGHNVVIEEDVVIQDDVEIGNNATVLARTVIGQRCVIGSNTVLGSIGFGFEKDEDDDWIRIPHIGNLIIGEDVEIGSSTVIARGTISSTRIGRNCKVDDNVFIAHNVQVGENTVIIANSEISGSVKIGHGVWIAPGVTIIEGVKIGNDSLIGIGSVVIKDVPPGVVAVGNPARILRER